MTNHRSTNNRRLFLSMAAIVVGLGGCASDASSTSSGPGVSGSGSASTTLETSLTGQGQDAETTDSVVAETPTIPPNSSPANDEPVTGADDPCRLLTVDEAEAALGREVELRVLELGEGLTLCDYYDANEDAGPASIHATVLAEDIPKDAWEAGERADGYEEVMGVGELAFYDGGNGLDVYADGTWISIQIINSTRDPEVLALLIEVGTRAVERL